MTPKRIQRRRIKGWRKPEGAISVCRPGPWGNPFIVGKHGTREECVALYAKWMNRDIAPPGSELHEFRDTCYEKYGFSGWRGFILACVAPHHLKGHDLMCFCVVGSPCHGDVLLRVANEEVQ